MGRIDELVSAEFAAWEQRGRGWCVWPEPVLPEPPFTEFEGYLQTAPEPLPDDSRRPGLLASLFDALTREVRPAPLPAREEPVEPEPTPSTQPLNVDFVACLPKKIEAHEDTLCPLLNALDGCREPTGFELFGTGEGISLQFAASERDAPILRRQLGGFFPELTFVRAENGVANAWHESDGDGFIVDFGLAHEFMLPLQTEHRLDPFIALVAALAELGSDETAVFQVLFQPVRHAWAGSVWRSVTNGDGKAIFVNRPHLITGTKAKLGSPLFAAVVRAAARAADFERAATIVRDMAIALGAFERMESNRLIPLANDEYPFDAHEEDLLRRQSRRTGMLLNREELLGFVHLPGDEVRSPRLRRQSTRTKSAPVSARSPIGLLLGRNVHGGTTVQVRLTPEQRVRHMHIIGASGTGKSTLLFNLIRQDIESGQGLAVLDPHGDLIERILGMIPHERVDDVILLDPTDEEYSIGFNILSAHSDFEKTLLASDLVSVFRRLSTSWGDQLNSVLNNAILAFLESSTGGTLTDLRRFLLDSEFRNEFLKTVRDPDIVYYWRKGFPQLGGNKSIGPVLTRLDTFLGPKPIRYMVSQRENRLDFTHILDSGKIFLAKLSQGQIGKENSFLLGSLLVSKFQQLAMSRQRLSQEQRRDFWLYIDEFQNFITPSMAEILSGARKYRIGLVLAHQELHQLQRDTDVASAVMSNPFTRIVFRVGDADTQTLAKGFASFEARDLQNLEIGEAICRLERSDADFNLHVPLPEKPNQGLAAARRDQVVARSREKYAISRAEIEAALSHAAEVKADEPQARPKRAEVPKEPEVKTEPVTAPPPIEAAPEKPPPPKPVAEVPKPVTRPADEGIGGAQHRATQKRIKEAGEALGFLAVIEKEIPIGSIDVWLQRAGVAIGCEISVTTTIDHEFGNVRKCIESACTHVAVISSKRRLDQIKEAVTNGLGIEKTSQVGYYTADEFIAWLRSVVAVQPLPASTEPNVTTRRGRTVTRKVAQLAPEELKAKEAAHISRIADVMRKKQP